MKVIALALLLLVAPCYAQSESIAGFSAGGSADEIITRIGEPTNVEEPVYHKDIRSWVWIWDYPQYGALFEIEAHSMTGVKWIRSLTIVSPCPWKLSSGAGIGTTASRLEQFYSNIQKLSDTQWFISKRYEKNVLGFSFDKGRVNSVYVGTKPRKKAR